MGQAHFQADRAAIGLGLWQLTLGAGSAPRGRRPAVPTPQASTPDQIGSLAEVAEVLAGLRRLVLPPGVREADRRGWIASTLTRLGYRELARAERGQVLRYLQQLTGYSRAQLNRLVARWSHDEPLQRRHAVPRHAFGTRYDAGDLALLAEVDALFGRPSGAVLCELLRRQRDVHCDDRFARLGSLSLSHLYQLRHRLTGQGLASALPGGLATRAGPDGTGPGLACPLPGHLRIDLVSLAWPDRPAQPCLRAIDEATRWQVLLPVVPGVTGGALRAALKRVVPFELHTCTTSRHSGPLEREFVAALQGTLSGPMDPPALQKRRPDRALDGLNDLLNLHLPQGSRAGRGVRPRTPLENLRAVAASAPSHPSFPSLAALQQQALATSGIEAARKVLAALEEGSPGQISRTP